MHDLICLSYPSLSCLEAVAHVHAVGATYLLKETNKYHHYTSPKVAVFWLCLFWTIWEKWIHSSCSLGCQFILWQEVCLLMAILLLSLATVTFVFNCQSAKNTLICLNKIIKNRKQKICEFSRLYISAMSNSIYNFVQFMNSSSKEYV